MTHHSIVAARSRNNVIGLNGGLPWHSAADMRYFRKTTKGGTVVMGRKTWESLPNPLAERTNVVVTTNPEPIKGALRTPNLTAFLDSRENSFISVIGGASIFEEALRHPQLAVIFMTEVQIECDGDTFFPALSDDWYTYDTYRINNGGQGPELIGKQLRRRSYPITTRSYDRTGPIPTIPQILQQAADRVEARLSHGSAVSAIYDAVNDLLGWEDHSFVRKVLMALDQYLKRPFYGYHEGRWRDSIRAWEKDLTPIVIVGTLRIAAQTVPNSPNT